MIMKENSNMMLFTKLNMRKTTYDRTLQICDKIILSFIKNINFEISVSQNGVVLMQRFYSCTLILDSNFEVFFFG